MSDLNEVIFGQVRVSCRRILAALAVVFSSLAPGGIWQTNS
jgi:hypothetical protein